MAENPPIKRAVISYDNMSQELMDAFREKYPKGYADYFSDIIKVEKPNGDYFHAVSLEVPGAHYLVKIKVKVDDIEDIQDDLFKDGDNDNDDSGDEENGDFPAVSDEDIAAAGGSSDGDEEGDE